MTYHFGAFRYEADQRLLFRGAERVPLVPKVADTLHVLIERYGKVVEKSELIKLVWPDTVVEEIGLTRNISILRKALEDESTTDPIIETVPRRGYRFAAPVTLETPLPESASSGHGAPAAVVPESVAPGPADTPLAGLAASNMPAVTSRRRSVGLAALVAFMLTAGATYYAFYVPSRFLSPRPAAALAVVPFECRCPGIDGEAFSQGLNEILVADLSQLPGIHVIGPSTVRRYQRARISMGLMGRVLGLDTLVEGSVHTLDEEVRVTIRLVDVRTGRVIWADTIRQPAGDVGAAQLAAARLATEAIGAKLNSRASR